MYSLAAFQIMSLSASGPICPPQGELPKFRQVDCHLKSNIRDELYLTASDIGTSDIGSKRMEFDIMSCVY
jgi:hypothetical protein